MQNVVIIHEHSPKKPGDLAFLGKPPGQARTNEKWENIKPVVAQTRRIT